MKNKNALLLVGAALAVLELSSCAALMRYKCNKEYAAKKGMDDAENGRTAMPARLEGGACDGGDYSTSDFSKDYNYGFGKKKDEVCQNATAAAWGRADGEAGNGNRPAKTKLRLCEDRGIAKLEAIYEGEYKKSFCAPARATKLGKEKAQSWQPADFETAFSVCKVGSKALKAAYNSAYRDTLASACTIDQAQKSGEAEANARRGMEGVKGHLASCSGNRIELIAAFEKSYISTKERLDKDDALRAAAAAAAARQAKIDEFMRTTAISSFPFQLRNYVSRCNVAGDNSYVMVDVENPYAEQVLIQGNWKVSYYNNDFGKITEDRTQEAVLVTGNNRKSFQKMTLPRDARFCRADYIGQALN